MIDAILQPPPCHPDEGGIFLFAINKFVNPLLNSISITYLNNIKHDLGL
jgi:hypothetical protein